MASTTLLLLLVIGQLCLARHLRGSPPTARCSPTPAGADLEHLLAQQLSKGGQSSDEMKSLLHKIFELRSELEQDGLIAPLDYQLDGDEAGV